VADGGVMDSPALTHLQAILAEKDARRGRPLTPREQLANLAIAMARDEVVETGGEFLAALDKWRRKFRLIP
jgi:hypothetical protein